MLELPHTVSYRRRVGEDGWGTPTFDPPEGQAPITLPARKQERQKTVRGPGGDEVLTTTRVLLDREVSVGDQIDGQEVQARESVVGIGGKVWGWVVYL